MKKFTIAIVCCLAALKADCQSVFEAGIKPTEAAFLNFEAHMGMGNATNRYGLLLGYRPATQNSGKAIGDPWAGAGSAYGRRFANKLYDGYTLGLYGKRYIRKATFLEVNAFYRNWHFDNKQANYDNVEQATTSYNGTRTENVNVYCMKVLYGKTFATKPKPSGGLGVYLDLYAGIGARYQQETYQTYNGTVGSLYYNYKKDEYHHFWPTPQFGVVLGLMHSKPLAAVIPAKS